MAHGRVYEAGRNHTVRRIVPYGGRLVRGRPGRSDIAGASPAADLCLRDERVSMSLVARHAPTMPVVTVAGYRATR
jgi:hypothetical protein